MPVKTKSQQLFDKASEMHGLQGCIIEWPELHILDVTPDWTDSPEDKRFRVYHAGGYCFEVVKEQGENQRGDIVINYLFGSGWDGFNNCSVDLAFKLLMAAKIKGTKI